MIGGARGSNFMIQFCVSNAGEFGTPKPQGQEERNVFGAICGQPHGKALEKLVAS